MSDDRAERFEAEPVEVEGSAPARPKRAKRGRRGAGEGTVFQRDDGRWYGVATLGRASNGRRRRRWVSGRTQREALDKLAKVQADRAAGRLAVEPSKLTLGDYLDQWLRDVARVRHRTRVEYARQLAHVKRHVGGVALAKLTKLRVVQLLGEMEREGVGARTRQASFNTLRKALADATRLDLVSFNVADAIEAPRAPRPERKMLAPEQLRALLAAADADEKLGALWVVLALTGARLGEGLALRWGDLDLRAGTLRIERALSDDGTGAAAGLRFEDVKTKRSRRVVELPLRAVEALRRHRARLKATPLPGRLVFADAKGGPLRRANVIHRHWHPTLKAAGLPKIGVHSLRHLHISMLLRASVPVDAVARRVGHSTASMTLDVYAHEIKGSGREVADRVQALLG